MSELNVPQFMRSGLAIAGSTLAASGLFAAGAKANTNNSGPSTRIARACAVDASDGFDMQFEPPTVSTDSQDNKLQGLQLVEQSEPLTAEVGSVRYNCRSYIGRQATGQLFIESHNGAKLIPDSNVITLKEGTFASQAVGPIHEINPAENCLTDGQQPIYETRETVDITGLDSFPSYTETKYQAADITSQTTADCTPNNQDVNKFLKGTASGLIQLKGHAHLKPIQIINKVEADADQNTIGVEDPIQMDVKKLLMSKHYYYRQGKCIPFDSIHSTNSQLYVYSLKGIDDETCTKEGDKYQFSTASPKQLSGDPALREMNFSDTTQEVGEETATSFNIADTQHGNAYEVKATVNKTGTQSEADIFYKKATSNNYLQLKELIIKYKNGKLSYLPPKWYK